MDFLTLTQSNWFIVGPVAKVLGFVMNGIYEFLDMINIPNIGIAIILFTIIVKALLLPLSIRQQKFSKLNSVMAPELQEIQKRYKGLDKSSPKYNEMLMKQQAEMKEVYAKYGTSPTGGCLQMLIQMPILFALYQVIYKIPGYVTKIYNIYAPLAENLQSVAGFAETEGLVTLAQSNGIKPDNLTDIKKVIDMFYNFNADEWNQFSGLFPQLAERVNVIVPEITKINYFLGIDLATAPSGQLWPGIFIPILAGLTQWLSTKMMPATPQNDDSGAGSTLKTMNIMMPLMSVFFCFTLSAGVGVYWIASAVVQILIQLVVNRYMDKVDVNEMVEKNLEKVNAKRLKQGQKPIKAKPVMNVHTIEEEQKLEKEKLAETKERVSAQIEKSTAYYNSTNTKKGKLASKAGMVQQYNERNEKKVNKK